LKAAKDVLERREAEIAALNENKFRSLANAIPHLVWIGRADGHVTWYNRRWFEYTGATQEQMEGWGWRSVHPDALPAVMRRWQDSLATGQPFDMTFPLLGADGRFRPFLTRVMPVLGSDGRVLQWFGANTDMSEQKEMEEALREAKREADRASRAKSQLRASASHDLRQPVQALVLLIGLAEGQVASLPRAVRTIGMMKAALNGLNTLLSATLEISRLDAGAVTPEKTSVDLGALLQRLAVEFAPIAGDKGLRLRASRRELHSQTDAALLERALRKLIENALRYTSKGGVLLGLRRRGANVRIDVVDTGVGVPRDKQAEIFEEFLQLHNPGRDVGEGLGLGLAIVDRLARLLGARVELSSQVGRGSRFSLSLALEPAVAAVKAIEPAQAHLGGRVLIVEDNVQLRFGLEASLQEWGYQTFTADSGEHALDVAAEEHWRLDMIVADYRLGVGLTGPATAQEIVRRAGRPFPVLVLTGDTAKERIAEIQSSGFALLHKPVAIDDLRREMMRLAHA
jgi:PAS domain S-box-containing protein